MANRFWRIVNDVISKADIILLLLDARMIKETMNDEIVSKVQDKPLIYVITKSDLVRRSELSKVKLNPSVYVSAKYHQGTLKLRDRILIEGKKAYKDKNVFTVGVLGYPNVGKSSLINAVKGKKSAPTSSASGFTRGVQKVKADNRITFLDTPGVIPYREDDKVKHALIGTVDYNKIKEPDLAVAGIMEIYPGVIEECYGVEESDDFEETIEKIAEKKKLMKKGNEPDVERASRMILKDWQVGKIRVSIHKTFIKE